MPRRGHSLSITTILKKAQRQGVSAYTLMILTERLQEISGQKHKTVTDDNHINVNELLRQGIRLHPFAMQPGPFSSMERGDGAPTSPRDRRSPGNPYPDNPPEQIPQESLTLGPEIPPPPRRRRSTEPIEDLIPPSLLQEDLSLPGAE